MCVFVCVCEYMCVCTVCVTCYYIIADINRIFTIRLCHHSDVMDKNNMTPFLVGCWKGHKDVIQYLAEVCKCNLGEFSYQYLVEIDDCVFDLALCVLNKHKFCLSFNISVILSSLCYVFCLYSV